MPSVQLQQYLHARAAGETVEQAAELSGIGIGEARLHEKDIESGDLELPKITEGEDEMPNQDDVTMKFRVDDGPGLPADLDDFDDHANEEANEALSHVGDALDEQLVNLAGDHLRGDVRDALLGWFKATPKPWAQLSEKEQRDVAAAADRFAGSLIKQACQIIAAGERPCIVAQLVEYKEKDGVEAKLKLPSKGEVVSALHEACGREVLIVTSGAEEFMGEAAPAEIDPEQPGLGIGDEYQDAA